jgi:hypothetical protein
MDGTYCMGCGVSTVITSLRRRFPIFAKDEEHLPFRNPLSGAAESQSRRQRVGLFPQLELG